MVLRISSLFFVFALMISSAELNNCRAGVIYDNGPISNLADGGLGVSFAYSVTDSFKSDDSANLTSSTIGLWIVHGDTPTSIDWSVGTSPYKSSVSSGTSKLTNVFQTTTNYLGTAYDIYLSTFELSGSINANETYWFTLSNGVSAENNYLIWDYNQGPSSAYDSLFGKVGSETFSLSGTVASTVPEPSTCLLALIGFPAILIGRYTRRRRSRTKMECSKLS